MNVNEIRKNLLDNGVVTFNVCEYDHMIDMFYFTGFGRGIIALWEKEHYYKCQSVETQLHKYMNDYAYKSFKDHSLCSVYVFGKGWLLTIANDTVYTVEKYSDAPSFNSEQIKRYGKQLIDDNQEFFVKHTGLTGVK